MRATCLSDNIETNIGSNLEELEESISMIALVKLSSLISVIQFSTRDFHIISLYILWPQRKKH